MWWNNKENTEPEKVTPGQRQVIKAGTLYVIPKDYHFRDMDVYYYVLKRTSVNDNPMDDELELLKANNGYFIPTNYNWLAPISVKTFFTQCVRLEDDFLENNEFLEEFNKVIEASKLWGKRNGSYYEIIISPEAWEETEECFSLSFGNGPTIYSKDKSVLEKYLKQYAMQPQTMIFKYENGLSDVGLTANYTGAVMGIYTWYINRPYSNRGYNTSPPNTWVV